MKHLNKAKVSVIAVLAASLVGWGGIGAAYAETVVDAIVPVTKIENGYFQIVDLYERFKEQNPDITINFDFLEHDAYHTKMQALAISDNLPDLMQLWPGKRTGYLTDRGYIRDLRDWIERDNLAESQKDIFLGPQGKNGEVWELAPPLVAFSNVVYVNQDVLDKLGLEFPKTLDEMKEQAEAIAAAGYRPLVMGDEQSWVMQSCLLSPVTARVGGLDWFARAVRGDDAGFDDPEFVQSLQVIKDMVDSGLLSKNEPSTTREHAISLLAAGKAAYFVGGIWEVPNLETSLSEESKAQIGMYPFPEIAGQKTSTNSSSGALQTGYGISASASEEVAEAAWKWIKFTIDPANADLQIKYGSLPTYRNYDISPMVEGVLNKKAYGFISSIDTVLPVLDDKMDAEGVGEIINNGLQELIMGNTTPEALAQRYEEWVAANDSNRK